LSRQSAGKWKSRFMAGVIDALLDEPPPRVPFELSDEDIGKVITKTLESTFVDAPLWSTRSMARATGMGQSVINRIWRAFGL
jgi:hypothetical protein